jgi:PAS domain S-box-containing protein
MEVLMLLSNFIFTYGNVFEHPITFVNVETDDQPLIYVNDAFMHLTGYSKEEILGKNCRFLQGPETDREAAGAIREAIQQRRPVCQDLLNYTKSGVKFYNRLVLTPIKEGNVQYYLGLQHQVTQSIVKDNLKIEQSEILSHFQDPLTALVLEAYMFSQFYEHKNIDLFRKKFADTLSDINAYILSL